MADRRGVTAVLLTGLAAQLAVATVGAMPWWALPLTAAAYVACGSAAVRAEGRRSDVLRGSGTGVAFVAAFALAPWLYASQDRQGLKVALGVLLVVAQIGQALGWRSARDLRSGLLASAGLLVLGASYTPDALIGFPLLLGWVALVVALAQLAGVRRAEVARATALAVALGLVAFLLVPAEPSEAALNRLSQLGSGRDRAGPGAFNGDRLDLRQRGSLPDTPVAYVPTASPPLWRSTVYQQYDGQGWLRVRDPRALDPQGLSYQVAPATEPTRVDQVQVGDRRQNISGSVWAPGPIVSVDVETTVRRVTVDAFGEVSLRGRFNSYRVESEEPITDPGRLASTRGLEVQDSRWRSLPSTVPERVLELSRQLAAGKPNRYAVATAITDYLRSNATYQLDSPVPLPGEDAVDRFLFEDRVGFCEQFASAQVVLLRAAGIPARLVTGLGYGVKEGNRRLFRVADRHAWVELWVPGSGWVSSDPTPAAAGGIAVTRSLRARFAGEVAAALRSLGRVPGGRPALALGLLLIAVAVGVLVGRRPRSVPAAMVAAPRGAPGPALAAFLQWDARQQARRQPQESLRELGHRVAEPGLRDALAVVEAECYAAAPPDGDQVRRAVSLFDR